MLLKLNIRKKLIPVKVLLALLGYYNSISIYLVTEKDNSL